MSEYTPKRRVIDGKAFMEEPIASTNKKCTYNGVVYADGIDQASMQSPLWSCDHEHDTEYAAVLCAKEQMVKMGLEPQLSPYDDRWNRLKKRVYLHP